MSRSLLAPRWLALHLATLAVVAAFVLLGWWQVDSYRDRDGRDRLTEAAAEPAVALASVVPAGGRVDDDVEGRRVTVTGRYDAAEQLLVAGRRLDGRTGFGVITPLRTADGSVVVVDRGWAPDTDAARLAVPPDDISVTAVLRRNEADSGRRGTGRQISAVSTAELLRALPYPPRQVLDGHVVLVVQEPPVVGGPTPVPPEPRREGVSAWRNLSYGLQWWLFAGAALFLWGSFVRGALRPGRGLALAAPRLGDHGPLGDERGERDRAGQRDEDRATQ